MLSFLGEGSRAYAFLPITRTPCLFDTRVRELKKATLPGSCAVHLSVHLSRSVHFPLQRSEDDLSCNRSHSFLLVLLITNLGVLTGHGICSCGRCICQDGWFGKLCQHSRKCNMTEEESRSLCESADGILCSGKGKNWQLSYPMSVPAGGKRSCSRRLTCMAVGCCLVTLSFKGTYY